MGMRLLKAISLVFLPPQQLFKNQQEQRRQHLQRPGQRGAALVVARDRAAARFRAQWPRSPARDRVAALCGAAP